MAFADGRPAQLKFFHQALVSLDVADKKRLGVMTGGGRSARDCTYRQYSDTFSDMVRVIDPSPVPAFRGTVSRAVILAEARREVAVLKLRQRLDSVTDALVEASVPDRYKSASKSLAVDWTDLWNTEPIVPTTGRDDPSLPTMPMPVGDTPTGMRQVLSSCCSSVSTPRWPPWCVKTKDQKSQSLYDGSLSPHQRLTRPA
jgi:hypothetical protein